MRSEEKNHEIGQGHHLNGVMPIWYQAPFMTFSAHALQNKESKTLHFFNVFIRERLVR